MTEHLEQIKTGIVDIKSGSPERFGYSWQIFTELTELQSSQFDGWTSALSEDRWRGSSFLDVGCGMGRNSVWACRKGAGPGLAIDVDDRSLAGARHHLASQEDVTVQWQSVYDLAYENHFDIVFSIGVIHHLADPELAVQRMARAAKPGGQVLIWVYGRENNGWIVHLFNPVRRLVFSRMPIRLTSALAWGLSAMLWLLLRGGWGKLPYHDLLRKTDWRHLKHIVFDHMLPTIARYYRREEAEGLLRQAGLVDIHSVWVNQVSWSVVGRKPVAAAPVGMENKY